MLSEVAGCWCTECKERWLVLVYLVLGEATVIGVLSAN